MTSDSSHQEEYIAKRKEPGVSWRQDEVYVLPENRLGIVSFALVCTMFLGALDQVSQELRFYWGGSDRGDWKTIVSIALPIIVAHLQGGNKYSWVGRYADSSVSYCWFNTRWASAYMLAAGAFGPFYGKLSNMFGGFFIDDTCRRRSLPAH